MKRNVFTILLLINWIAAVTFSIVAIKYVPGMAISAYTYAALNLLSFVYYMYNHNDYRDWFRTKRRLEKERAELVELVFDYRLAISRLTDRILEIGKHEAFKMIKTDENESSRIKQSVSNDT